MSMEGNKVPKREEDVEKEVERIRNLPPQKLEGIQGLEGLEKMGGPAPDFKVKKEKKGPLN